MADPLTEACEQVAREHAVARADARVQQRLEPIESPSTWRGRLALHWTRLRRSQDWLKNEHCKRGLHWMSWWRWYDAVVMPGGMGMTMTGWFRECRVCHKRHEHDARASGRRPRFGRLWPFRVS